MSDSAVRSPALHHDTEHFCARPPKLPCYVPATTTGGKNVRFESTAKPRRRKPGAAAAVIASVLAVIAIPAAAYAGTNVWQDGVQVSHSLQGGPSTETVGDRAVAGCGYVAQAEVQKSGDYVFVADFCADGRSAVAKVRIYNKSGSDYDDKVCRNKSGKGTWVRCNWDWIETNSEMCTWDDGVKCGNKALIVGTYDAQTGATYWDHGTSIWFSD